MKKQVLLNRKGFTVLELLIASAILALMLGGVTQWLRTSVNTSIILGDASEIQESSIKIMNEIGNQVYKSDDIRIWWNPGTDPYAAGGDRTNVPYNDHPNWANGEEITSIDQADLTSGRSFSIFIKVNNKFVPEGTYVDGNWIEYFLDGTDINSNGKRHVELFRVEWRNVNGSFVRQTPVLITQHVKQLFFMKTGGAIFIKISLEKTFNKTKFSGTSKGSFSFGRIGKSGSE